MQSKNSREIMVLFKTEIFVKPYFTGVETMVSTETYIPASVIGQCGTFYSLSIITTIMLYHFY